MRVTANDKLAGLRRVIAELRQRLDERNAELNEALQQQSATADVLRVVIRSRGDLAPASSFTRGRPDQNGGPRGGRLLPANGWQRQRESSSSMAGVALRDRRFDAVQKTESANQKSALSRIRQARSGCA
jgi:hypothetical protein